MKMAKTLASRSKILRNVDVAYRKNELKLALYRARSAPGMELQWKSKAFVDLLRQRLHLLEHVGGITL
jgi:hypothetical protein